MNPAHITSPTAQRSRVAAPSTPPAIMTAALREVTALLRVLTPAELEALATGSGRLVYQPIGAASAEPAAGAPAATAEPAPPLELAPPVELTSVSGRPTELTVARTPRPAAPAEPSAEVTEVVRALGELTSPAEVEDYLRRNTKQFTTPMLKQVARGLGPTVSAAGRTKTELRRNIVEGTAGFRLRAAAMSGGAWS